MTTAETGWPSSEQQQASLYWKFNRFLERHLPTGLYRRSLIILIAPLVLLQSIMAGIILDRHWDQVTKVLSRSLSREIGLIIDLYERSAKTPEALSYLEALANDRLRLGLTIMPDATLPEPVRRPLFSAVDTRLTRYLTQDTGRPFWIDSSGQQGFVDIRVQVEKGLVFRILSDEDRAYAAGTNTFLFWMFFSSLVLAAIAIVFLRNQIKPILQLAEAAQKFGMGRDVGDFHPRGAAEVRLASQAFLSMKDRIERHVEQRTAMLAGVSHDLRTILTRFKLELAFLGEGPKIEALKEDVAEMQRMLEAYMAFVRGDGGEKAESVNIGEMLRSVAASAQRGGRAVKVEAPEDLNVNVKPNAFRRLLLNLAGNAMRFAKTVQMSAGIENNHLKVLVDDDGPGIPEHLRDEAFRPFVRLDHARNQDETGTGLGLAISLDIARAHGGDLKLAASPFGGLRAIVDVPI
jgi:two-component system osmolarity sensor histidine kinase EnvZ